MEKLKPGFDEFIASVAENDKEAVLHLHKIFTDNGCKIEVKEAKSGFLISYTLNKKSVANFVFRKSGLLIRIYANHVQAYMEFLHTLPEAMIKSMETAPACKRLINPEACNSKCAMGYDYILNGKRQQKCRNGAFMFLVCKENNAFINSFIENELKACV